MTPPAFDPAAVHEKLGTQAYSDHEVGVMLDVLQEQYPGRTLETLTEGEWLRACGLMHQRKKTGWMTDEQLAEKAGDAPESRLMEGPPTES